MDSAKNSWTLSTRDPLANHVDPPADFSLNDVTVTRVSSLVQEGALREANAAILQNPPCATEGHQEASKVRQSHFRPVWARAAPTRPGPQPARHSPLREAWDVSVFSKMRPAAFASAEPDATSVFAAVVRLPRHCRPRLGHQGHVPPARPLVVVPDGLFCVAPSSVTSTRDTGGPGHANSHPDRCGTC